MFYLISVLYSKCFIIRCVYFSSKNNFTVGKKALLVLLEKMFWILNSFSIKFKNE